MPRLGTGLQGRVVASASSGPRHVDDTAAEIFGSDYTAADRKRVVWAVNSAVYAKQLVRAGRGVFRIPGEDDATKPAVTPQAEDDDLTAPEQLTQSVTPARRIAEHFGRRFVAGTQAYIAWVHEEVSEMYRAFGMAQIAPSQEEPPTGYRVTRYASTSSTVTVRREPWEREA